MWFVIYYVLSTCQGGHFNVKVIFFQGLKYAGTQNSDLCFCDNSFGQYGSVDESECAKNCKGKPWEKCGGEWRNSLFSMGKLSQYRSFCVLSGQTFD